MMSTEPENNNSSTPETTETPSLVSEQKTTEENVSQEETKTSEETSVEKTSTTEPLTLESFKIPEEFSVDEEAKSSFVDILNDDKLSAADRAQKLIDLQVGVMTKAANAISEQWNTQQTTWQSEVRADPEIGGANLEPTLGKINVLLDKYGSTELRGVFDLTGAGNNPHMIKFLSKIANDLGEGGPVLGGPPAAQAPLANKMYPSMKN
jgi:hypothetical protein